MCGSTRVDVFMRSPMAAGQGVTPQGSPKSLPSQSAGLLLMAPESIGFKISAGE